PDGASIILNASIVASKGLPEWSVYRATKAAVRSFARTWTTDLKDRRIRVNAVSLGFTEPPAWQSTEAGEQRLKTISNSILLDRPGRPGWLPTPAPHRSGLAHHAHPVPHLMNSRPARSVVG